MQQELLLNIQGVVRQGVGVDCVVRKRRGRPPKAQKPVCPWCGEGWTIDHWERCRRAPEWADGERRLIDDPEDEIRF